jgi:polyvinyl alcohol dehydrogenase (cytochrome)
MFGQNYSNTSSAQSSISAASVSTLNPTWTFTTGGDVSARAAVVNGVAYFPDWAGNLYAVNTATGKAVWSHQLSDYGLAPGTAARTSPAVSNGVVYIGTQYVAPTGSPATQPPTGWLLAVNAASGKLVWKIRPDTSNQWPVITASPVVANGVVFVGMTANDEFAAVNPNFVCCSARGNVVAVNAATGNVLWQTFTVPAGYSGGAVWGSNPVVDTARNTLFIGTGNNYSAPTDPAYVACIAGGGTAATCQSPSDHSDSILALDLTTGSVKWSTRLQNWNQGAYGVTNGSDDWNVGCVYGVNCPPSSGPDYDFGSAPNEITYTGPHGPKTIIGAGQKSGLYYALDPDTGAELWQTQVGPGSSLGGLEWGSASDGTRIYVAVANFYGIPYAGGNAGSWAALDPATGQILWQVADPNGAIDLGPVTVANGVVYAGSMAGSVTAPTMFALDASSGKTLWSFAAGSSVIAGATVVGDYVFWGSGYAHLGIPGYTGNNKFYAFSPLNGNNCTTVNTGTYTGNVTVSAGQTCTFSNGGVRGNVTLNGGTIALRSNSFVTGNLQITGAGTFSIGPAASIGGDLQIQNLLAGPGTNTVCGASITGDLQFTNNGAAVTIGSSSCAGNTVGGNLQIQNNTAPVAVFSNHVSSNLQCSGNSSITGGNNTAASKQGQCATF